MATELAMKQYNQAMSNVNVQGYYKELSLYAKWSYKTTTGHVDFMTDVQDFVIDWCSGPVNPARQKKLQRRAKEHLCQREFDNFLYHFKRFVIFHCGRTPGILKTEEII